MRQKGHAFYYDTRAKPRKWLPLGSDYQQALIDWAKLEGKQVDPTQATFRVVFDHYKREIYPTKAPSTQYGNDREAQNLLLVFGNSPLDTIEPLDVRKYMDARGKVAPVRANRERALLSHVWNFARSKGYTKLANPCRGIARFTETGRDKYVSDTEFRAVWNAADWPTRDAMDLAYLTGQRPSDVLKLMFSDITDGLLHLKQNKTHVRLRILVEGELADVIERIRTRDQKAKGLWLVQDENGQRLTYWQFNRQFNEAIAKTGVEFQFRDLRGKAATDLDNLHEAQLLLGHANQSRTEKYVKRIAGSVTKPNNRKVHG